MFRMRVGVVWTRVTSAGLEPNKRGQSNGGVWLFVVPVVLGGCGSHHGVTAMGKSWMCDIHDFQGWSWCHAGSMLTGDGAGTKVTKDEAGAGCVALGRDF